MDLTPLTKFFHWVYQKLLYLDVFSEVVANSKRQDLITYPPLFEFVIEVLCQNHHPKFFHQI